MVATPAQYGIYQRFMLPLWDERDAFRAPTGFQSIFGRPETGASTVFSPDAEVVYMDIIRNAGEHYAKLVPRNNVVRSLGSLVSSGSEEKFSEAHRVFPLSIELFDITSDQVKKRIAGEPQMQPWTQQKRLRTLSMNAMKETVKRTIRMFEILASQSARTGKQDAIIGEATPTYDWRRNAANTIDITATSTVWTNAASNPIGDMDDALNQMRINGGQLGDYALVGVDVWDAFVNLTKNQNLADNRRYEVLYVDSNRQVPSKLQFLVDGGFEPRGEVVTFGGRRIWFFTYLEGYDLSGTWTPYMPVDQVLLGYSGARCDRQFGPSVTFEEDSAMRAFYQDRFGLSSSAIPSVPFVADSNIIRPEMFYFDAYPNNRNTVITHRTQSAPIFGTTEVDSFALLTNVV